MANFIYTSIFGALIALALVIIVAVPLLSGPEGREQDTLNKLIDKFQQATEQEISFTVDVPDGGAIIGMSYSNFTYSLQGKTENRAGFDPDKAEAYQHIKGFHMSRPDRCGTGFCICRCDRITLDDITPEEFNDTFGEPTSMTMRGGKLVCAENLQCAEAKATLDPWHKVESVFQDTPADYPSFSEHYWRNSFILLNSNIVKPDEEIGEEYGYESLPLTVAGYADRFPQSQYRMTLQPATTNGEEVVYIDSIQ